MTEVGRLDADLLAGPLTAHVPRQRWFSGGADDVTSLTVASVRAIDEEEPALAQVLVRTRLQGGQEATHQLVLTSRPVDEAREILEGKPEAVVSEVDDWVVYDAMVDPGLDLRLLAAVAPDEPADRARPLMTEQSNTSVVYDERLILKLFRRVDGSNPDAEVTRALVATGFANVAQPVAEWSEPDRDFAVVSVFLAGATDGFHLAVTSLRDLFDRGGDPTEAGGDFGPDARRLGIISAKLHLALAEAFGAAPADAAAWAADMEAHLPRVSLLDIDPAEVRAVYERLRHLPDPGVAVRVHGDYHLGQVLRTDAGWFVLDFEGEPDRPLEERRRPSSPMRDVAGMVRSFHYAAQVARREWGEDPDGACGALADAWERHNVFAFLEGYHAADGIEALLPREAEHVELVRAAFELDKAVYEVGYEQGHRPDWVDIPLAAVRRILEPQPR